jgi:hypothetical protein
MIRERVLAISTVLALVALSGAAQAAPRDKSHRPNQAGPQSTIGQTAPDWYRARAMQPAAPPAQIVREGSSGQYGCRYRYQNGPKSIAWC